MKENPTDIREKLSALLDGELDMAEQEITLQEIKEDDDLVETWQRYHLIRAAVRRETMFHIPDITSRIAPILEQERERPVDNPQNSSVRWVPGLALAASIAAIAVFGLVSVLPVDDPSPPLSVAEASRVDNGTKWDTATPEIENTLNAFLVEHGEFTPMSSMNGLMTYAKFVSYDASE